MDRLVMRKKNRRCAFGLFALGILLHLLAGLAYSSDEHVARLTDFTGTVVIQSRGDWGVKPEKGLLLYSMDKVVTRTGTAVVTFNDGAVAEIKANTNLLIEEQEKTGAMTRNLRLLLGKLIFRTGKGSSTKTNLQTPTAVVGLRGTAGTLSIGVDGKSYIQFTEGGSSYTVGDFLSGVAKDVPQELADLNPAQRAAFVAAAAADQAKNAMEAATEGKISDPQAALAAAKAAEAAALEAKAAAEAVLNNPALANEAQAALDAANKAVEAAKEAQDKAIKDGANPEGPMTYTPTDKPLFDVDTPTTVMDLSTTVTFTTTTTSSSSSSSSSSSQTAPTTTLPSISSSTVPAELLSSGSLSGSIDPTKNQGDFSLSGQYTGALSAGGSFEGVMTDGSRFGGYMGGVMGSWRGVFSSIFVDDKGDAGFLYGRLAGDIVDGRLDARGRATRTETKGHVFVPEGMTIQGLLGTGDPVANSMLENIYIPGFEVIEYNEGVPVFGYADEGSYDRGMTGAALDNKYDSILGVWSIISANGEYYGADAPIYTEENPWQGNYAIMGGFGSFMAGTLSFSNGPGNHTAISGQDLDYLDWYFMGKINLEYTGHYDGENYRTVGTGSAELQALNFSGMLIGASFFNDGGSMEIGGLHLGLIGSPSFAPDTSFPVTGLGISPGLRESGKNMVWLSAMGGELLDHFSGVFTSVGEYEAVSVGLFNNGQFSGPDWDERNLIGASAGIYKKETGEVGLLTGDRSGNLSQVYVFGELGESWKTVGTWTAKSKEPVDNASNYQIYSGDNYFTAAMAADFGGGGSIIGSSAEVFVGRSFFFVNTGTDTSLPWGAYYLMLGNSNSYEKPEGMEGNSLWSGAIGGEASFGRYQEFGEGLDDVGYWLAVAGGTWSSDGDVRGSLTDGTYLTRKQKGTIQGSIFGMAQDGSWIAASSGTFEGDALAWSGEYKSGKIKDKLGVERNMHGIIGSLDPLATVQPGHSVEFTAIGDYEGPADTPFLWNSKIRSQDADDGKGLFGFTAGIVRNGTSYREMDGAMVAIFDVDDNVGLLTSYDPESIRISSSGFFPGYRNPGLPDRNDDTVKYGVSGTLYRFNETYGMWKAGGSLHNDPNPFLGEAEYNTETMKRRTRDYDAVTFEGTSFNLSGIGTFQKTHFIAPDVESGMETDRGRFGVYNLKLEGDVLSLFPDDDSDLWFTGIRITKPVDGEEPKTVAKALMFGSLDGDEMRGVLVGIKHKEDGELVFDRIFKGPVFGLYNPGEGGDTWIGESIGTWKKHVLMTEGDSLFYNNGGMIAKWARDPGLVDLTVNQNGERSLLAVGEYFETTPGAYNGPVLQSTRMSGDLIGSETEAYEGLMSATWKDGTVDGMAAAIYLSSDGSAGLLTGNTYGIYANTGDGEGMWVAEGPLNAIEIVTGLNLTPEQFHSSILVDTGTKTPNIRGSFLTDDDVEYGKIKLTDRSWKSLSIEDQPWSISSVQYAGTYQGSPSNQWAWETDFSEKGVKKFESYSGTKWSDGVISGQHTGAWVNWDQAVTGVMGGQIKGTFNPASSTWQAVASGVQLETTQFMDMIASGKVDALQKLNIPCLEVGRATLNGSSNLLNVQMKDVTFLASRAGGNPKIWATKDVSGTFSGVPGAGHNVGLSGGGLNANFTVNNWANSKWGANVAGSGTLQRTDVGGNVNVNFQGAAAGNYTGTSSGNFAGTGSGVVK